MCALHLVVVIRICVCKPNRVEQQFNSYVKQKSLVPVFFCNTNVLAIKITFDLSVTECIPFYTFQWILIFNI